ncbi:MAG: tetratricopeptide repeat protein, partial [Candidatus Omnitrophota bacterium]
HLPERLTFIGDQSDNLIFGLNNSWGWRQDIKEYLSQLVANAHDANLTGPIVVAWKQTGPQQWTLSVTNDTADPNWTDKIMAEALRRTPIYRKKTTGEISFGEGRNAHDVDLYADSYDVVESEAARRDLIEKHVAAFGGDPTALCFINGSTERAKAVMRQSPESRFVGNKGEALHRILREICERFGGVIRFDLSQPGKTTVSLTFRADAGARLASTSESKPVKSAISAALQPSAEGVVVAARLPVASTAGARLAKASAPEEDPGLTRRIAQIKQNYLSQKTPALPSEAPPAVIPHKSRARRSPKAIVEPALDTAAAATVQVELSSELALLEGWVREAVARISPIVTSRNLFTVSDDDQKGLAEGTALLLKAWGRLATLPAWDVRVASLSGRLKLALDETLRFAIEIFLTRAADYFRVGDRAKALASLNTASNLINKGIGGYVGAGFAQRFWQRLSMMRAQMQSETPTSEVSSGPVKVESLGSVIIAGGHRLDLSDLSLDTVLLRLSAWQEDGLIAPEIIFNQNKRGARKNRQQVEFCLPGGNQAWKVDPSDASGLAMSLTEANRMVFAASEGAAGELTGEGIWIKEGDRKVCAVSVDEPGELIRFFGDWFRRWSRAQQIDNPFVVRRGALGDDADKLILMCERYDYTDRVPMDDAQVLARAANKAVAYVRQARRDSEQISPTLSTANNRLVCGDFTIDPSGMDAQSVILRLRDWQSHGRVPLTITFLRSPKNDKLRIKGPGLPARMRAQGKEVSLSNPEEWLKAIQQAAGSRLSDAMSSGLPQSRRGALALQTEANRLAKQGRYKEAVPLLTEAVRQLPDDTYILNDLLQALVRVGDFEKAIEIGLPAVVRFGQNQFIRSGLTLAYIGAGMKQKAAASDRIGIRLPMVGVYVRNQMTQVYRDLGMLQEALQSAELGVAQYPGNDVARNHLTQAYMDLRMEEEAVASGLAGVAMPRPDRYA